MYKLVEQLLDHENCFTKLYALLHDASEAYLGDMPRPIKKVCPWYKEIEENIMNKIL